MSDYMEYILTLLFRILLTAVISMILLGILHSYHDVVPALGFDVVLGGVVLMQVLVQGAVGSILDQVTLSLKREAARNGA